MVVIAREFGCIPRKKLLGRIHELSKERFNCSGSMIVVFTESRRNVSEIGRKQLMRKRAML